MNEYLKIFKK